MTRPSRGKLITQLRHMLDAWKEDPRSDVELLNRFVQYRDEAAFTFMVARHGKGVWDICRAILGSVVDAEDAFQSTFIQLSQRAAFIVRQKCVQAWLHGVARRVSWTARRTMQRRKRLLENATAAAIPGDSEHPPPIMQAEIAAVLRAEVEGLPETLRVPLVQRYLEEKTLSEIAFVLGCTDRAVAKRLARGEEVLRRRLLTRGLTAGSATLAALFGANSLEAAPVPASVVASTIKAALSAAPVGPGWFATTTAVLGRLLMSRVGLALVVLTVLLVVGGAFGLSRLPAPPPPPPDHALESDIVAPVATDPGSHHLNAAAGAEDEKNPLAPAPQPAQPPQPDPAPKDPGLHRGTVAVSGQVTDASGKVIPNARVVVVAPRLSQRSERAFGVDNLVEGNGNDAGRYRLDVPDGFASDYPGLGLFKVLVHAPGYGLGTLRGSLRDETLPLMHLDVEKPLTGRLLDPRGQPAAGVRVAVVLVGHVMCQDVLKPAAGPLPPHWPKPVITDADGRYVIAGLGRKEVVQLVIDDERYGMDNVFLDIGQEPPNEMTLRAPRVVQGRLLGADTHKALAGVRVTALKNWEDIKDLCFSTTVTDAEGHFRLRLKPGVQYSLEFVPPDGLPYLSLYQPCPNQLGPDEKKEFTLPPGVPLAGRVIDAGTGKPIPNVRVQYVPPRHNNPDWRDDMATCPDGLVVTDSDGRFNLAVCRAGGHVLLHAQEDEYRIVGADVGIMTVGKKTGRLAHANAVVPIERSGDAPRAEMKIELLRGVSVKGAVVRPDGQPLNGGYLVCRRRVYSRLEELRPVMLSSQGKFTLDGCEIGRSERVLIVDSTEKWGAIIDVVPPAPGTEPMTVRVERCGQALVTLVDEDGMPLPDVGVKLMVYLQDANGLLGKPSPGDWRNSRILGIKTIVTEMVTDRRGQLLLPCLVPNATYRLVDQNESQLFGDEIQVGPDQRIEVKAVVRKR